ncbi:aminotransferase class V-fold PLP-dependent enzyme [Yoonia sediminilitoris]|uniref:Cysteine desulfurase family protein (TIGR01976 family) n=1 Tax=Yoonia sediminilitoris TaxID=1286148 RepID=A0A2T6K9B2_9RHOB|nr:aminotransferase class V-fold PLP-dependent enzyme [Yoonia sediminilitoris]PUB11310.1 cysteine desulfurase family protein (TIGR01976 family) [Yoonia sediminilitoris]RCW91126.1 cysteine desulfurase family protein (TIGR01976 family) [Yoonia sediminilitoris]
MDLDNAWVRAQFPAFDQTSLQGHAFFENAGGSYPCRQVVDRLCRFYTERKVQPYAPYEASRIAGEEMDEARSRLAEMLGVADQEVSFGPSTTQNTYVLAQAVRQWIKPGQHIIVTNQDHEANSGPWRRLADQGVPFREWQINPQTGELGLDDLANMLDERTALVVFPHCSNVVGAINDVAAITEMAHAAGARVCVDGVAYAPHGFPDVGALGCDVYLFSAYKTYGPHQGIMVIREAWGMELPNQGHYFNGDSLYKRFTPAGPDHAQVAASAGMADYIDALSAHHGGESGAQAARLSHDLMRAHEVALLQPVLDYASAKNAIRLIGPGDANRRSPTVALEIGRNAEEAAAELAAHGIMAGGGDFYAQRPLQACDVDLDNGVLRVSFVHYTSKQEVDGLLEALDQVL